MPAVSNPFVDYLTRYTTASPDHEAAFDEFLAQAAPPPGGPLRLETRVEAFVQDCFARENPPSVILTGNAGDGKTYLCRKIVATFVGQEPEDWEALAGQSLVRGTTRLHVIKDLSELSSAGGVAVLQDLASAWSGAGGERYLIAANEGRLRALLAEAARPELAATIDDQLKSGPASGAALIVINLNAVTTSSFVPQTLKWMTADEHWAACAPCPARERCPLRHNAQRLREPDVAGQVQLLYQLLEHLDIHVTMRDMLIHLAYTLSGNRRCHDVQRPDAELEDQSSFAYYQNIWGREDDAVFRRKASVTQHLNRLRIGEHSLFEIDDFIVSGGQTSDEQEEHRRLFAPLVDLHGSRFAQDREAYLSGGADKTSDEEERALRGWLPHCRRKLFFEWRAAVQVARMIPFLYFDLYRSLLRDERGVRERVLRSLVTGLNRAFSHLYLSEREYLYVTTQYLHSGEQPRPLVRLRIPLTDLWLETENRDDQPAYNCERRALFLVVAPPAQLRRAGRQEEQLRWQIGLLQFEYLQRLAHGGTFNILAEECELDVRSLKDQLLSRFASTLDSGGELEFFVAERHRYSPRRLWLDENGNIRG